MSDLTKTIDIVFGAKNDISPVVGEIESSLNRFDAAVQNVAQPLAAVADQVLKTEAAILALAAAFTGAAIDAAGKFGDAVNEIGTLFGGTREQVNQFGTDIQNYAAGSTQSIASINGAIYEAISSGVQYEDSIKFINEAEKLSVAGRADLQQVTSVMTGVLNAYGASTDQAAQYTDDLYTAVLNGKTTVPELAQSLGNIVGITANVGVGFDELSAAIAAMTASSVKTPEAITGIKAAISNILSPSKEAADAAKELGLQFDGSALRSKGLAGVLAEVQEKTHGNTDSIKQLFGSIEGYNAALILGSDKSGIFAKSLQDMANNTGAVDKAFAAMSQNYEVALQRMGNAADVAMIKAGKPLLDEFGGVANGIAAVFKSLGTSIDAGAFDPIINALEVFGQSMAGTLQQLAQNLPEALSGLDFSGLIRSFDNLGDEVGDAFEQIFGRIDLSTPEGLRDALQMIVDGVAALTNVTAGIVDGLEPVFAAFGGLARSADSAGEDAQIAVGQFLGAAELIVSFGTKLGGALIALQEYGSSFESIFDVVIGTIRTAFNAFQIAVDGVAATFWEIMRELASGLATVLPDSMGGAYWQNQVEGIDALLNGFAQRQRVNFDDLSAGFTQAGQGLGLIKDEAGGTTDALDGTADGFGGVATAAGNASGQLSPYGDGMQFVAQAAKNLGISLDEAKPKSAEFAHEIQGQDWASPAEKALGYKKVIDELGNVTFVQVGNEAKKVTAEVEKSKKEMEQAAKQAVDYDLKLQEIQSKERIAYIEAKFNVDEAQIKADAERVAAAFESINTAITSTGDTLTSLIGTWADLAGTFEGQKLWDLIQNEEKRRQDTFEQQKLLVDEQIAYLKARTAAMTKGDALIKISADGLTPHLEKIFHEILRACQIKANEQGLELLLSAVG